ENVRSRSECGWTPGPTKGWRWTTRPPRGGEWTGEVTTRGANLMNKSGTEASVEGDAMDEINLEEFLKANESQIRWAVESLVLGRVTEAIGQDNLRKVTLSLQGSTPGDWAVHVEGPDYLKARIEEALRKT